MCLELRGMGIRPRPDKPPRLSDPPLDQVRHVKLSAKTNGDTMKKSPPTTLSIDTTLDDSSVRDVFREVDEWTRLELLKAVCPSRLIGGGNGYASASVFASVHHLPLSQPTRATLASCKTL
jgi:hypothetical protein